MSAINFKILTERKNCVKERSNREVRGRVESTKQNIESAEVNLLFGAEKYLKNFKLRSFRNNINNLIPK